MKKEVSGMEMPVLRDGAWAVAVRRHMETAGFVPPSNETLVGFRVREIAPRNWTSSSKLLELVAGPLPILSGEIREAVAAYWAGLAARKTLPPVGCFSWDSARVWHLSLVAKVVLRGTTFEVSAQWETAGGMEPEIKVEKTVRRYSTIYIPEDLGPEGESVGSAGYETKIPAGPEEAAEAIAAVQSSFPSTAAIAAFWAAWTENENKINSAFATLEKWWTGLPAPQQVALVLKRNSWRQEWPCKVFDVLGVLKDL